MVLGGSLGQEALDRPVVSSVSLVESNVVSQLVTVGVELTDLTLALERVDDIEPACEQGGLMTDRMVSVVV